MSEPTIEELAAEVTMLKGRIDELAGLVELRRRDIVRLSALTDPITKQFIVSTDKSELSTAQLHLHVNDVILNGRHGGVARALVDETDKLVVNFGGDFPDGVEVGSDLNVVGGIDVRDSVRIGGALTTKKLRVGENITELTAEQFRVHAKEFILDGQTGGLARALVDMGERLIVNFDNDYPSGVMIGSDLFIKGGHTLNTELLKVGEMFAETIDGITVLAADLRVTGSFEVPGGDVAEEFDLTEASGGLPGTVMIINADGRLEPCASGYDTRVAGVVSGAGALKTAMLLNRVDGVGPRAAIALVGSVYCNCDASLGSIAAGDLLTTSPTPGHAMRADLNEVMPGSVIGKALKPLAAGRGQIPVFVTAR